MGLLNWLRKCLGGSDAESDDTEHDKTCARTFLQLFRKKKYRRVRRNKLNYTIESMIEINTNILEENGHHSEDVSELINHQDHNENTEIRDTSVWSNYQKFDVAAEITVDSSEEMTVPALKTREKKKDLNVNNFQPQTKDKAQIVDFSNEIIPIIAVDECTVDSLYSQVVLTLANYKNMTKFLEPVDEYVSFELSAIRCPDATIQDLLKTLEYNPLNTHKSAKSQGNFLPTILDEHRSTISGINPVQKTKTSTSRASNVKNEVLPISCWYANTGPCGVRLPLTSNTGQPRVSSPLTTNTGPPGVRLPLKINTGPPGVKSALATNTGPPGVKLPFKTNTGPPGVELPFKTNTGPPGVRLPLKINTGPPGVKSAFKTNAGPPGVKLPLKTDTGPAGVSLPLKTNTGPPGVKSPMTTNTGPKLGSAQNTKPQLPLPSTSSQGKHIQKNTNMTASSTESSFECASLTRVKDDGYIINGKVNVHVRNWNCITGTKKDLHCEVCKIKMVKIQVHNHTKATIHMDNLKKCGVLAEFGLNLIRKVYADSFHCGICNIMMTKVAVQDHAVSVEHKNNYTKATEAAKSALKQPEKLTSLDKFYTIKEEPIYLRNDSLLKVVDGGFIINRATILKTRSWNAFTGTYSKRFCNVCQIHADGKNGYSHMFENEHKKNLKKYNYLHDYKQHLIRKLPNEQFHCGICDDVFANPTAHISKASHREGVVESSKKVAAILDDPTKYTTAKF